VAAGFGAAAARTDPSTAGARSVAAAWGITGAAGRVAADTSAAVRGVLLVAAVAVTTPTNAITTPTAISQSRDRRPLLGCRRPPGRPTALLASVEGDTITRVSAERDGRDGHGAGCAAVFEGDVRGVEDGAVGMVRRRQSA
jgi:hypothetical protein